MGHSHAAGRGRLKAVLAVIAAAVLVILAAAAGTSFAGASSSPSPDAGKVTLRLGWNEGPLNLNPFIGYSTSYEVWMLNYDTLVGVGADGLPSKETGLAAGLGALARPEDLDLPAPPGRQVAGRRAAHGADVAFTFNTIIEDDLSLAIYLKDVTKAVAVDDTTLKVYCTQPKANMLLTQVYIYVLPRAHLGQARAPRR